MQRKQAITVYRLDAQQKTLRGRSHHPGEEEGGEVVGDDDRRVLREGFDESLPGAIPRLDVGVVGDAALFEPQCIVDHPVNDESMEAIRSPSVSGAQRLQHDERESVFEAQFHSPLEPEVPACPSRADHPVEDE